MTRSSVLGMASLLKLPAAWGRLSAFQISIRRRTAHLVYYEILTSATGVWLPKVCTILRRHDLLQQASKPPSTVVQGCPTRLISFLVPLIFFRFRLAFMAKWYRVGHRTWSWPGRTPQQHRDGLDVLLGTVLRM
ncbi:hypothetical protein V8F33_012252 [Rhypophila sp. PSN 637]